MLATATAAVLAAAALAASPSAPASEPRFELQSRQVLDGGRFIPPASPAAHPVALSVVVEAGSRWIQPGVLEAELGKASAIFARCGVALGPAEVLTVRWTGTGLRELNDDDPYHGLRELGTMSDPQLPARRPVAFLFQAGTIPASARAYNRSAVARLPDAGAAKVWGSVWITPDWHSGGSTRDIGPGFSVLAHELAHVLGDLPHVETFPNLMTNDESPGAKSGDLDDAQCAAIRSFQP